jgi:hypothetical protein
MAERNSDLLHDHSNPDSHRWLNSEDEALGIRVDELVNHGASADNRDKSQA